MLQSNVGLRSVCRASSGAGQGFVAWYLHIRSKRYRATRRQPRSRLKLLVQKSALCGGRSATRSGVVGSEAEQRSLTATHSHWASGFRRRRREDTITLSGSRLGASTCLNPLFGSKASSAVSLGSADVQMGRFTQKWLVVWLLLQAVSFSSEAQEISIADIGSYGRCPMSVFSTDRVREPSIDFYHIQLKHYSVFHHSDHEFIHDDSDNVFEFHTNHEDHKLHFLRILARSPDAKASSDLLASLTVTSHTHTTTSRSSTSTLSTTHTTLTSTRSSTTTATTTSTTRSSTVSTTLTSVTSTSSSITSSSSTLTTGTTTTTLTNTTTTSTTYLGTTGTTTTLTESTTSVSSTTETATTSTATSLTTSGTSTSRTSTSITTMTLSSSTTTSSTTLTTRRLASKLCTITRTGTTVTGTGTSSTVSSTSSTSITTSQTTTTVLPQPCGNACPLYAISGCLNMMPGPANK
eukprot:s3606_g5.t1